MLQRDMIITTLQLISKTPLTMFSSLMIRGAFKKLSS